MSPFAERVYASLLRIVTAGRGLAWRVDEETTLRIDPRCRWIRNAAYEADVVRYLRDRIRPGHCCIDVGAHVGFYAMQMALWNGPGGRVIAFEPNPTARAVLTSNVALNGLSSRITIEAAAVGAVRGTENLFHGGETTGLSRLGAPNPDSPSGPPLPVPVVTLDDYCAKSGVRPDWLLVDAEGADLLVLEGAAGLLRDTPMGAVVEMHAALWDPTHTTPATFAAFLRRCGRVAVPITGQAEPLRDYGSVSLIPNPESSIVDPQS